MGLSVSDAVRVLLTRIAADKALPFDVAAAGYAGSPSVDELMADLNAGD